jgi:hypothetical protein
VTYSDPLVMCLRVVYYLVQLATLAIAYLIQQKVRQRPWGLVGFLS